MPALLNEADSNTVELRSLERIDGVAEVLGDDPILVDSGVNDCLGDDLRPLLGEELVPLGGTGSLVSVTGDADLGSRVLLEGSDDLVDLELLARTDIPLVDDEEDIALERLECRLDDDGLFLLHDRCRCRFRCRCGCRRGNHDRCGCGLCLTEAEGQTGEGLDLEVSLGTNLGVEVVVDEARVAFEVEGDHIGKPDVEAKTSPEGGRDAAAIPKIIGLMLKPRPALSAGEMLLPSQR